MTDMKLFSRSTIALLSIFLSLWTTTLVSAKHAPNTKCNVYDLLEDCKDTVIDISKGDEKTVGDLDKFLTDECREMSGLLVAKCLMKYLCINHGEKAVEEVKECVQTVCPLAKRLPPKLCHK